MTEGNQKAVIPAHVALRAAGLGIRGWLDGRQMARADTA